MQMLCRCYADAFRSAFRRLCYHTGCAQNTAEALWNGNLAGMICMHWIGLQSWNDKLLGRFSKRRWESSMKPCRQMSAAVGSVESKSLSRSELRRQSCGNVCMEIVGRLVEALECPKHLRTSVATCHHLPSLGDLGFSRKKLGTLSA